MPTDFKQRCSSAKMLVRGPAHSPVHIEIVWGRPPRRPAERSEARRPTASLPATCLHLETSIRQHENFPSQIRLQRTLAIVAAKNAILPNQQIRIPPRKLFPTHPLTTSLPLANQEKIEASDCFVIELRIPAGDRESLQSASKLLQRLQHGIQAQISKRQTNMIDMMKALPGKRITFKASNQFVIAHKLSQAPSSTLIGSPPIG
jgi:hypothetical protein